MPLNARNSRPVRAKSGGASTRALPAASKARRVSSAPDIESAGVKGVDVGLSETARVARQRMFEAGEREARFGHRARLAARQVRVGPARRNGVGRAEHADEMGRASWRGSGGPSV